MLRVALFPYLPEPLGDNNESLRAFIEQEFEREHPDIDLYLRPFNVADDFYTSQGVKAWLSDPKTGSGPHYDVVEIDAVLLGELKNDIEPWPQAVSPDWLPQAAAAVQRDGKVYGIPHWLCAHYVISRSEEVVKATSFAQLATSLAQLNTDAPDLIGDLTGSWNMPSLYLDAFHDTFPARPLSGALSENLDPDAIGFFGKFARLCGRFPAENPCLTARFGDNDREAATAFGRGEADALLGYSERLHYVTKNDEVGKPLHIRPAPLGSGNAPLFFVDAFVARKGMSASEQKDAAAFAAFMNAPRTHEAITMSLDASGAPPRYLLPATKSAYEVASLKADALYQQLTPTVQKGDIFPTEGFEAIRSKMRNAIRAALAQP